MPGPEFFQTQMGRTFYEATVPSLVRVLNKLADHLRPKPKTKAVVLVFPGEHGGVDRFSIQNMLDVHGGRVTQMCCCSVEGNPVLYITLEVPDDGDQGGG